MFRLAKSLKFQIGVALLSLIGLFVYFSMHTLGVLEEQRMHGSLLRLAGELQVTAQHMAMQAMNYQKNAPTDEVEYSRDLKLYYQDLMLNTKQFGSVCRAFSTGNFDNQIENNESMPPMLSDITMDAAYSLEEHWNNYLAELKKELGSQKMPQLASAADYIVNSNLELTDKTKELLTALDTDIRDRTEYTNRVIRISFVIAMLLAGGIMLWFYLQVLKPLGNSVKGFKQAATGNFEYKVPVAVNNEIGWLSQTFNQLSARLGIIFKLTTRLQEGSDLDQTLQFVSRTFPQLLPLDWVGVLFVTNDQHIQLERSYSDGQPEQLGILRFPLKGTLLEKCLEDGNPLHIPDVKEVATLNPAYRFLHVLVGRKRRDAIFLPVTRQSPIPGVLVFATRQAHAYHREHLELLSNLATVITLSFGRTLKLAEHARLAAIGQFASGIAHEIRTPLATVSMALDYLRDSDLPESAEKRTALASNEMARINRLLEDMLLYAKPLKLQINKVNLNQLLEEAISSQRVRAEAKGVTVIVQGGDPDTKINADYDRLLQIFINLVQNAIDAAPEDSAVKVSILTGDQDNVLGVTINNGGAPIPEDQVAKLFEPFFTTKPAGTGLGLAIVRRLSEAHGGSVEVVSDEATGTTFTLRLPQSQ